MKKLLLGFTAGILLLIGAGAVAYANDWISFTGDDQVAESGDNVDEIMDILKQVNNEKMTAEQALEELQDMNPPGLVKKIEALEEEVAQLEGTITLRDNEIEGIESDLATANDNYNGAVDRITELEGQLQNTPDQEYVEHLEAELLRANEVVEMHNDKTQEAVEEARTIGGSE